MSPAGVAHADVAVQRFAVRQPLGQPGELPFGLRSDERAGVVDHGDPGRIVTAVLEAPKRIHDHGDAIALTDIADDTAHSR